MDNKDFDKIFSEKLQETQSFEYMESDWENVAGRIQAPEKEKPRGGWLWLLGLGFLFMAGTSIYLANSLNKTNQHLVELKAAVAKMEKEPVEKVDTIFTQMTIIQYDTVVNTKFVDKPIVRESIVGMENKNIGNSIGIKSSTTFPKEKNIDQNTLGNSLVESTSNSFVQTTGLNNNDKAIETKTNDTTKSVNSTSVSNNAITIESLWLTNLSSSLFSEENKFNPVLEFKEVPAVKVRKKKQPWKNLSVGITGGTFLTREIVASDESQDNSFEDQETRNIYSGTISLGESYGFDVGVLLQYQLSPKFQLTGSVHYQQVSYGIDDAVIAAEKAVEVQESGTDAENFESVGLNPPDPPTTGTNVAEFDARYSSFIFKQQMLDYRLGANYIFRENKKWRPYLGLSLSAVSTMKQTLRGEESDQYAIYNNSPTEIITEGKPGISSFRLNGVIPSAGFQFRINPKLNWQIEAWYRQGFDKEKEQLNGVLGLRSGISYRF